MTTPKETQDDNDRSMSNDKAARIVQDEPALQADPQGNDDDNAGIDDDARTPDQAATGNN
jgi:hypothetical protein